MLGIVNIRYLLEIAEYISLIGSVAGSFAAMVFGEVAYATVPMSLSILLNFVNRYQLEQQNQSANTAIQNTHQQILANIQSLNFSVLNQPAQDAFSEVLQGVSLLKQELAATQIKLDRLASLSASDTQPVNEDISQLTNNYTNLLESINALKQQFNALLLSERIEVLQNTLFELIAETTAHRTHINSHLSTDKAFDIEPIKKEMFILEEQNTAIQEFLDALVYRMLSDGSLSSRVSSDEIEKRLSKIIEYYKEQREQKRQKYIVSTEQSDNQSHE